MSERERLAEELSKRSSYVYAGPATLHELKTNGAQLDRVVPSELFERVLEALRESGGQGEAEMIRAGLWMAHYEVDSKEEACIEALIALPDAELLQRAGLAEKVNADQRESAGQSCLKAGPHLNAPAVSAAGVQSAGKRGDESVSRGQQSAQSDSHPIDAPSAAGEEWESRPCEDHLVVDCLQCYPHPNNPRHLEPKQLPSRPYAGTSDATYAELSAPPSGWRKNEAHPSAGASEGASDQRVTPEFLHWISQPSQRPREAFGSNEVWNAAYSAGLEAAAQGSADDLRALGWSVAVHNDYWQDGRGHTFWLVTQGDRCLKGEGPTDAWALNQIRSALVGKEAKS